VNCKRSQNVGIKQWIKTRRQPKNFSALTREEYIAWK